MISLASPRPRRALVLLLFAALAGCAAEARDAPSRAAEAPRPSAAGEDGFSVYALDDETWRDATGEARTLASLAGTVRVVAMVYTHCAHTCPRIVADLKRVEAEVEASHPGAAGLVLVTLDPERDTPERLREFAGQSRLPPERWTLLTGTEEGTRALAALLSVRYREEAGREIAHTNAIVVLDREGRIVHRRTGLDEPLEATIAAVRAASE